MSAMHEEGPMMPDLLSRHFDRHRDATQRPSSQPAPILRRPLAAKRQLSQHSQHPQHSSNITSKDPANTHVISSIIASLDGIDEATVARTSYTTSTGGDSPRSSTKGSSLSRASSRRAPSVPAPVLRRSISLGVDHGAYTSRMRSDYDPDKEDEEDDYDDDDDAAAFPVIRTSRRPSGRSPHTASPLMSPIHSPTSSLKDIFRSPSRSSRNSRSSLSLGASDIPRPRLLRSNFSGDTLSKRLSNTSQLSLESKADKSTRKPSRETLRPATIREERVSALVIDPGIAKPVEQGSPFSTLPPTPTLSCTSPTGRLYLDESAEDTFGLSSQESEDTQARAGGFLDDAVERAIEEATALPEEDINEVEQGKIPAQPGVSPTLSKPSSPKKNPITDAIPLRVSSLNRTPPPRQKKSKTVKSDKGKRVATSRSPWQRSSRLPKDAAQNLLEGLDQEDTTVKRIRELQRKREDRLNNESAAAAAAADHSDSTTSAPAPASVLPNPNLMSTDAKLHAARPSNRPKEDKQRPKTANRAQSRTSDGRKAHKVLGLDGTSKSAEDRNSTTGEDHSSHRYQSNHSASSELNKRRLGDTSNQNAFSSRPLDLRSNDPTLRHPLDNRHHQHAAILSRRASTKSRLLNGLDLEAPDLTPPSTSHSIRSRRSRSNSNNLDFWSHPDIPGQTSDSIKERRKSMSDARHERVLEEEILEERRNSVHTAVEDYLAAPRLNQKVRTAVDGRLISFSEVGDPRGAAVIVCVGMGLTRFVTAFYDELAATLGLRLITLDRPGVGESEPYPERERVGPLSWPDDVVTVTQHLGISKFSILAHSAGAIYALATALILPHCIKGKVHLLAPWIPPSQFDTYGIKSQSPDATPVGALPRSQRLLRVLPIPFFKAANGGLFSPSSLKPSSVRTSPVSSPSSGRDGGRNSKPKKRVEPLRRENAIYMEQVVPEKPVATMFPLPDLSEEDASGLQPVQPPSINLSATAFPTDPEFAYVAEALNAAEHSARARQSAYSSLLTERTWMVATRNSNPAVDLLVCLERNRDIGFRYVDIQRQIIITHGSEDKRVPAENIRWIGEQINRRAATNWNPDAKQEFRERGGCEVRILPGEGHGLMASAIVMADVLSEIAGEWLGRSKW